MDNIVSDSENKETSTESTSVPGELFAIDKLCRLCCTLNSVENDLFEPEDDLQSKLVFMHIQVRRDDGLPQRVCGACRGLVLQMHYFCSEAKRAQHRLRGMLGGAVEPTQDPMARQDRSTQTECLPDVAIPLDIDTNLTLVNVKEEPQDSHNDSPDITLMPEPCDVESDDTPLVEIHNTRQSRKRQGELSYLHEVKRLRPDLLIQVKSEQQEAACKGSFTHLETSVTIKPEPDQADLQPKKKRGRPRKYNVTSCPPQQKKKRGRPKKGKNDSVPPKPKRNQARLINGAVTIKRIKPKKAAVNKTDDKLIEKTTDEAPATKDDEDSDECIDNWEEMIKESSKAKQKMNRDLYTCCICSKTLENHKKCLQHYSDHKEKGDPEPPPPPPLSPSGRCPRCSKPLEDGAWPQHWRRHWQRDQPMHRCTICAGELDFRRMCEIVQHGLAQHTKEKSSHGTPRYMCDECPIKFVQMRTLLQHRLLRHEDAGSPMPRCARCSFVSKGVMAIRHHVKRKHDSNPHLCPHCGKTFVEAHHLKRHVILHTGEKPFKCRYCGKGFAAAHYLPEHERIHTGEKPHACSFCGRGFSQRSSRMTHERSVHSQERPYVCQLCGRGFATKGFLTSHLKSCFKQE